MADARGDMSKWYRCSLKKNHHFRATSGSGGEYCISGIRFRGVVKVSAFAEDYACTKFANVVLKEGDSLEHVDIVVGSGRPLVGRLLSPEGIPVTDAVLRAAYNVTLAYTDTDGFFEVTLEPFATAFISAYSPLYGSATFSEVPVGTAEIVELTMPGMAVLGGRVTWRDGTPAEGMRVRLQGGFLHWDYLDDGSRTRGALAEDLSYTTVVDDRGQYEIRKIDVGQFYFKVAVEDDGGDEYAEDELGFLTPNRENVWNAELENIVSVGGVVRGLQSGEPICNGNLQVWALRNGRSVDSVQVQANGGYLLRLPSIPEPYLICPSFDLFGYVGFEQYGKEIRLEPGGERILDLTFIEPFTMSIRVIDESGQSVSNAAVTRINAGSSRNAGRTDDKGRFLCRGLIPNFHDLMIGARLTVQHPGFCEAWTSHYNGQPGAVLPEETVVLYRPSGFAGSIVDSDGTLLAGAKVMVVMRYGDNCVKTIRTRSDKDGAFDDRDSVPATTVAFEVTVSHRELNSDQTWEFLPVVCVPGETVDLGELVFSPPVVPPAE